MRRMAAHPQTIIAGGCVVISALEALPVTVLAPKLTALFHRGGVKGSSELDRILALPSYRWQDDPELPEIGAYLESLYALPKRYGCLPRCGHAEIVRSCSECQRAREACTCRGTGEMHLRPVQIAALQCIHDHEGMIANIRVGGGKTLISYLAGVVRGVERTLILVPAKLVQKTHRDFAQLKRHWRSPRRLHIMSYELLARDRGLAELNAFRPDLVVTDESQKFKNLRAACTIRMHRYLTKTNPDAGYIDMSGTMTKRSILEYHHRTMWAVPADLQPLPRSHNEAAEWADAIDEKVAPTGRLLPGALLRMCSDTEIAELAADPCKSTSIRIVREAYSRRLLTAPGVVGTEDQFDGAMSLQITGQECTLGPSVIEAFARLRGSWELPDGHPIESPADLWRHARELVQGFFYRWEPAPPRDWLMIRKLWSATLRQVLRDHRDLESPLIAVRAVDDGQIPWAEQALADWRAIKPTYTPTTVAEWIDDSCLQWVEQWASDNTGIVWCYETKFAARLAERTGLPYYGAKGLCNGKMIEDERGTCIASIKANNEGRNLQYAFADSLIVSCPPGGDVWEQLLGRTHRDGQEADEVTADVILACYEQWDVFRQARRDAEYVERTMRQAQKLNFADVDVAPEAEIQRRHASGDPLWCKDNARFFEGESDRYSEQEIKASGLPRFARFDPSGLRR
jgi:hypothetical protein